MTKQILTVPSTLKWEEKKKTHLRLLKKKKKKTLNSVQKLVVQGLSWTGSTSKELRFLLQ